MKRQSKDHLRESQGSYFKFMWSSFSFTKVTAPIKICPDPVGNPNTELNNWNTQPSYTLIFIVIVFKIINCGERELNECSLRILLKRKLVYCDFPHSISCLQISFVVLRTEQYSGRWKWTLTNYSVLTTFYKVIMIVVNITWINITIIRVVVAR